MVCGFCSNSSAHRMKGEGGGEGGLDCALVAGAAIAARTIPSPHSTLLIFLVKLRIPVKFASNIRLF